MELHPVEKRFFKKHSILDEEKYNKLTYTRKRMFLRGRRLVLTYNILLEHIDLEKLIVSTCRNIIELRNEETDDEKKLKILGCERVVLAYSFTIQKFIMDTENLEKYLDFCCENVQYIKSEQLFTITEYIKLYDNIPDGFWRKMFYIFLKIGDVDQLLSVFWDTVQTVSDPFTLWEMMISKMKKILCNAKSPDEKLTLRNKLDKLYKEWTARYPKHSLEYLEWSNEEFDIIKTRQVFEYLSSFEDITFDVYEKMVCYERILINYARCRHVYDLSCQRFGANLIKVWDQYYRFELSFGNFQTRTRVLKTGLKTINPKLLTEMYKLFEALEKE